MKTKNEFELYFKKISKEILNIERITERKLTNKKSNENNDYTLNKKFFYVNKQKDEIKNITIGNTFAIAEIIFIIINIIINNKIDDLNDNNNLSYMNNANIFCEKNKKDNIIQRIHIDTIYNKLNNSKIKINKKIIQKEQRRPKNFFKANYNKLKKKCDKNRKKNIFGNYFNNKIYILLIIIILIINSFCSIKSIIFNAYYFQYSKITLKVKGIGESAIFNNYSSSIDYLNEVYINGNNMDILEKYFFNQTENFVELIWNNDLDNTDGMFSECTDITEINLSNFNTSLISSMSFMFSDCSSLTSLDLSNFDTSYVQDMVGMFFGCSSLTSLDLSNFNTSLVRNMFMIFQRCSSLISLDLSNFNTSYVHDMGSMFCDCVSLTTLDLSNFDTSLTKIMDYMFCNCFSLISLNLSNYNTSYVHDMRAMFYNCTSLTSLDLSNFNTSCAFAFDMESMFYNCISLTSLDLSNFNTTSVSYLNRMFYNCLNLEYINLNNFDLTNLNIEQFAYEEIFYNIPENVVICIDESITDNYIIISQIKNISCYVIDCSNDWKSKQKKLIDNTNECIDNCENSARYKYEYNGKCFNNCINGFLFDDENNKMNKCKCELNKCDLCPQVALSNNLCTKCNDNYYQKEDDPTNLGEYINCFKDPEGYYLENNLYKKCYYTCKLCDKGGNDINHNCIECNENFLLGIKKNDYFNCYKNCSYYHYFDNNNNLFCTVNLSCPYEYPQLIEDRMECVEYLDFENIIKDILNNEKNETKKSKEEEIKYYDNILKNIENGFTSEKYDTYNIDKGEDEIIKTEKVIITLTTSKNQKNSLNNNNTKIDLGECETLLRNFYNISDNETLYMKKIDIIQEGIKAVKVEYDVYCKLFGTNLIKLNLTICGESKISISIPYIINEHLDKLNSSSGYYNDICYTTTSKDGTDISLKDRQTEFVDSDKIVCQEGCDFSEYNFDTYIAKCSCEVKESSPSIADMNINKAKLLENFKDIKNIVNFKFLICYKQLFNKKGFINNIGCYLILIIILFHIMSIFIFSINNFPSLKAKIKNIALGINQPQLVKENKKESKKKINDKFDVSEISIYGNKNKKKLVKKFYIKNKKPLKNSQIQINLNPKKLIKNPKTIIKNPVKINKKENIKNYIDEEINELSYNLAKKIDKRTFCQYYFSLIKTQHSLICALFNNSDYNSGIIKIDLFLIGFAIEYTVNALFYNDETMHKIYESKGQFDLENQIPIIVYSTLISMLLNSPLNFLALSNDAIIKFKQANTKINIIKKAKKLKKVLIIKFILYFIISFFFLLFFWYYISMFCVIYKNTQIHLLKDILYSIGLSLFIPFVIYLFPGIFRIPALSNKKNKKECLYNFSKLLQSF